MNGHLFRFLQLDSGQFLLRELDLPTSTCFEVPHGPRSMDLDRPIWMKQHLRIALNSLVELLVGHRCIVQTAMVGDDK